MYSTDSPFETSHLPWPLCINWTPATPCSWLGPGLFPWQRTFSLSPIRDVCKRYFHYTNLLAHWPYGTLITLAPLRQGPIIFFSMSFASFLLARISRSQLYAYGHLTPVLPNSLLTSNSNSKIFLGTFVWSIFIIYPTNSMGPVAQSV